MAGDGSVETVGMTPFYMPPEAVPGGRVDRRGDLYSAAMTLFEMLNGRSPTRASPSMRCSVACNAATGPCLTGGSASPLTSRTGFGGSSGKALARDPAARWQDAGEFIRALEAEPFIDWTHESGTDLEGTWVGWWPPSVHEEQRRGYRVVSERIEEGKLRVTATQRLPARAGVSSALQRARQTPTIRWGCAKSSRRSRSRRPSSRRRVESFAPPPADTASARAGRARGPVRLGRNPLPGGLTSS